jgi:hypothetical protein
VLIDKNKSIAQFSNLTTQRVQLIGKEFYCLETGQQNNHKLGSMGMRTLPGIWCYIMTPLLLAIQWLFER